MKTRLTAIILALVLSLSMVSVAMADTYYMVSSNYLVDAVGWWFNDDVAIFLNAEAGTYTLMYKQDIFGTTDPGIKGNKTVIYKGTCSVAPAADGETSHLDVTINTVESAFLEQHGKAFGRQVLNFDMVLDSENWAEEMEDIYGDTVEAFVSNHSGIVGMTLTVQDLTLDYDDVTLNNRIMEMPDLKLIDITE